MTEQTPPSRLLSRWFRRSSRAPEVVTQPKPRWICPRYEPHPAHSECTGLTEYKPHHFDARMGYEEYVRCCNAASNDPIHVPWPR